MEVLLTETSLFGSGKAVKCIALHCIEERPLLVAVISGLVEKACCGCRTDTVKAHDRVGCNFVRESSASQAHLASPQNTIVLDENLHSDVLSGRLQSVEAPSRRVYIETERQTDCLPAHDQIESSLILRSF